MNIPKLGAKWLLARDKSHHWKYNILKNLIFSLKKPGMNCLLIDTPMDLYGTNSLIKSEQAQ